MSLGLRLRSPVVASAGPWGRDELNALADAGAGAVVLPSLFEEEIVAEEVGLSSALEAGSGHFAEALDYFPATPQLTTAVDRYLELLQRARSDIDIPVASLNAMSSGAWARYARLLAEAGADALELNVYRVATDPRLGRRAGGANGPGLGGARVRQRAPAGSREFSPYYSAMAGFGHKVLSAGAAGLVLFNRFYRPDLDLERMDVVPKVELSRTWELRLPLRWTAVLRPQLGPGPSLAVTSGAQTGTDVVKVVAVGADVAMMTSAILRFGLDHVRNVESELRNWLAEHGYTSVAELRGSLSQANTADASAFERANYLRALHSWTTID